jgi:hypothetical protein
VAALYVGHRRFVFENNDFQDDPTTRKTLEMISNRFPDLIFELDDYWCRIVSQLNVFPRPGDILAQEVLAVVQELGKTVKDKNIEITDETLKALASLVTRVAAKGTLLNADD